MSGFLGSEFQVWKAGSLIQLIIEPSSLNCGDLLFSGGQIPEQAGDVFPEVPTAVCGHCGTEEGETLLWFVIGVSSPQW